MFVDLLLLLSKAFISKTCYLKLHTPLLKIKTLTLSLSKKQNNEKINPICSTLINHDACFV